MNTGVVDKEQKLNVLVILETRTEEIPYGISERPFFGHRHSDTLYMSVCELGYFSKRFEF